MNIFFIEQTNSAIPKSYTDAHICKIPVEIAQMLANCYSPEQLAQAPPNSSGLPRKHSYFNHPMSKWVRAGGQVDKIAIRPYMIASLGLLLLEERAYRFPHYRPCTATKDFLRWIIDERPPQTNTEPYRPYPPSCTGDYTLSRNYPPEEYLQAHREYYALGKRHLHKWTNRDKPEWIDEYTKKE